MGVIFNSIIALLIAALVIWIVSKLNLGLTVKSYGSAIIAAIVIAVVAAIVFWLLGLLNLTLAGGLLGWIVMVIIAAVILRFSDRFLPGMEVHGFKGAIIAAIGIGVVSWILSWILGLLGITV
jgi:putative membrane protein